MAETMDFYAPTLSTESLILYDKKWEGTQAKILMYTFDDMFHVFRRLEVNDIDGQRVMAYEILSFTLLCCTEWHGGRPVDPCQMNGSVSTLVD